MKPRWLLTLLVVLATAAAAFWWVRNGMSPKLGTEAYEQTEAIVSIGPRPPGSTGLDAARAHVRRELEQAGWVVEGQKFERMTPNGNVAFENLRARFSTGSGIDPWKRRVDGILCAHIDSKQYTDIQFVGADDAASACAAIVVIARILAENYPEHAARMELVFFDGEESFGENITPQDGLYGSRHYANQWRTRDDKPSFGILLDMIGHKNLSIRLPSDTPVKLKETIFAAAKAEKAEQYFGMAPGPIIDDHVPLNFAGIPTVDVIGDFTRSSWWHTPGDNMKIISPESLDISIRVTLRAIALLLEQDDPTS
jgi:hypothetical protein